MKKPLIAVSACLLGKEVRYDGGHSRDPVVVGVLGRLFECVELCPETGAGLPVPRPPMRLSGEAGKPALRVVDTGKDLTGTLAEWAAKKVSELAGMPLCGFVLKSKSPSCGKRVKVFDPAGRVRKRYGAGIFAQEVLARFPGLPVEDEVSLSDPVALEAFIEAVFARAAELGGSRSAGRPAKRQDPEDEPRTMEANGKTTARGGYVLYWMQQAQRAEGNPALEHAIALANRLSLPVVAVFGLSAAFPEANLRHYAFMLEGLAETEKALRDRGVLFAAREAEPPDAALALCKDAAAVVCDAGYTRIQRQWSERMMREAPCRAVKIETDVVVPVHLASNKAEYAARTIRPKIEGLLERFLAPCPSRQPKKSALGLDVEGTAPDFFRKARKRVAGKDAPAPVTEFFPGGASRARVLLSGFLENGLAGYDAKGDRLAPGRSSLLAPYLHFGQISPVDVALAVKSFIHAPEEAKKAYLEQLIVRRELGANFAWYAKDYDRYSCVPDWARKTLARHAGDPRPYLYGARELEAGKTHDRCWNAAMAEMRITGFLGNTLRMYWGKKVLEWSEIPEQAFSTLLNLNNKYFLDGRDPNSFTGVAWCFGLHDRPFTERAVFGMVRSMTAEGLARKGDTQKYVARIETLRKAKERTR
ncbi:MAG: 2-thiouracil desulfurase family protein [Thermodesulfobacteriota bacterium]